MTTARLVVVGLSHRTADLDLRGRVALPEAQQRCLLQNVRAAGADEAVVLATCNRTELYLAGADAVALRAMALEELCEVAGTTTAELEPALVRLSDDVAALHLNRVAAGLDSLVPGETEILGQVKSALAFAETEGAVGPVLSRAFQRALQTGKRARHETRIGSQNASVSSVAAEFARDLLGDLGERRALLLGAGRTSELTALNLLDRGLRSLVVANRTYATACSLAERLGAAAVRFDEVPEQLGSVDVVVSSTSAPHAVLYAPEVAHAMEFRGSRPLVFIDLAVPRDIDEAVADIEGCRVHDLDSLREVVARNVALRRQEAEAAEAICGEAAEEFRAWQAARVVVPAIASLHARAEDIRQDQMSRLTARWPDLDEAGRERVERMSRALVQQLLHDPTTRLRERASHSDGVGWAETVRELFGLDDKG